MPSPKLTDHVEREVTPRMLELKLMLAPVVAVALFELRVTDSGVADAGPLAGFTMASMGTSG